uniref:NADH-ubiquinone oxidoreductase chain 2 n=1 Tax=Glycinde armigera TaxID=397552 RepID=A0A0U2VSB5_9ANNE|nr:NADH dehydrogenase subunit 2 [Glycinde armigera]
MPYFFLFLSTLILGSIMSISSNHWIFMWMGLEINLLSFIPLVFSSSSNQESEASVKYFLVQATGSSLLLLGSLSYYFNTNLLISSSTFFIILSVGLMMKMGVAPFHFWLPQVMSSISWFSCMCLATWQKVAPLLIINKLYMMEQNKMIMSISLLSVIMGGIGGLNQTQLRPLLAYSSISHLGWMLMGAFLSTPMMIMYFLIYSITTLSIMWILMKMQKSNNSVASLNSNSLPLLTLLMILFLSLGGLPPLLGFLPKWGMIQIMSFHNMLLMGILMLSFSLLNLFYYMNIFFNLMLTSAPLIIYKEKQNIFMISITIISTLSICIFPFIMIYAMILLHKPQSYWNFMFYSWNLIRSSSNLHKTINSSSISSTWSPSSKSPVM